MKSATTQTEETKDFTVIRIRDDRYREAVNGVLINNTWFGDNLNIAHELYEELSKVPGFRSIRMPTRAITFIYMAPDDHITNSLNDDGGRYTCLQFESDECQSFVYHQEPKIGLESECLEYSGGSFYALVCRTTEDKTTIHSPYFRMSYDDTVMFDGRTAAVRVERWERLEGTGGFELGVDAGTTSLDLERLTEIILRFMAAQKA